MTYNLVKVSRTPLAVCLQCPLCHNLVHEATTISECLHTFCKDCIYQQLGDGESDCCPICNVNLGCSPLEKLRVDRQLDDVRAKIFPAKLKKRKVIDESVDHDAPVPVRRKERSLSSLGIGVPSSANPGFVNRKTKSVSRRSSMAIRDTGTDSESGEKKSDIVKSGVDSENEGTKRGDAQDTGSSDGVVLEDNEECLVPVKKEVSDEEREINEVKLVRKLEQLASSRKDMLSAKQQSRGRDPGNIEKGWTRPGMYVTEKSKVSATGSTQAQGASVSNQHSKPSDEHYRIETYSAEDRKLPAAFSVVRERTGKGMKRRSALAQLAEIAVGQEVEGSNPSKLRVPRAPRGRGVLEKPKLSAAGENLNLHSQEKIPPSAAALPPHAGLPPLFKSSTTVDKMPVVRHLSSHRRMPVNNMATFTKQKKQNAGFWFVLQAADTQMGTNALPQIATRYLRIKDGKLPISIVKKYLVKKLHLKSENEVEITCRGQPVVPNLPLESVRGIWFATMPSSSEYVAPYECRREIHNSAEDYLMVLTYGRHRRPKNESELKTSEKRPW